MIARDSLEGLRVRRKVCCGIIRELMQSDDSRAPDALKHYREQLATLDEKITAREKAERARLGIPEPPDIIVGLKSALITSKAQ